MKKLILVVILAIFLPFSFKSNVSAKSDVLRVYNWEEYIDEGDDETNSMIDDWITDYKERTGIEVEVVYDTFATNEVMLNNLKTGKTSYDLVCPSEYAIQKMIRNDMLDTFDYENGSYTYIDNYNNYGSPYLKALFVEENLSKYSVPYMWGTLGMIYNPEFVSESDVKHWDILWDSNYNKRATVKDSIRDTYVTGVYYTYFDEVMEYKEQYESGLLSRDEYNNKLTEVMNRTDKDTIRQVQNNLLDLRNNIYGFEVDNGKNDIATGRIWINTAWSGDAVYSIEVAYEENETDLFYSIPEEGSNIFFDGWVMPKGANKELAQDFVNFLCKPENAARNMNYIGYTSSIAGNEIFELATEWYAAEEDGYAMDLTYFFDGTLDEEYLTDGKAIIYVETPGQFNAQYPTEEQIARCCIMADFGDSYEDVLNLWKTVKSQGLPLHISITGLSLIVVGIVGFQVYKRTKKIRRLRQRLM